MLVISAIILGAFNGCQERINKDFPLPVELEAAVGFWQDVFTQHDSNKMIIHDRDHLDVIYDVIDVPKDDSKAKKIVDRYISILAPRLRKIENGTVSKEDIDLKWLVGRYIKGAANRVRGQRGIAGKFSEGIEQYRPYRKQIEAIFYGEGLPVELAALSFVESTFNTKARSKVSAGGVWQIMPKTALELGITKDERFDVLKATYAAAKLLKYNYNKTHSWPLAITAYNHGLQGVQNAVDTVGSENIFDLILKYNNPNWGFASKNFYVEFWASQEILNNIDWNKNQSE